MYVFMPFNRPGNSLPSYHPCIPPGVHWFNILKSAIICENIFKTHSHLKFFSSCSKPNCVAQGSPKTYFVFTPSSIYHIFSKLLDPVDLTSHLIFVNIYMALSLCFYGLNWQKKANKMTKSVSYHTRPPYQQNNSPPKNNLSQSKIGWGRG